MRIRKSFWQLIRDPWWEKMVYVFSTFMYYPLLTWKAFPRRLSSRSLVRQFPQPEHAAKHVTFCSIPGYTARRTTQWKQYQFQYTGMHQLRKSVQPLKDTTENFSWQSSGVCQSCFRFFLVRPFNQCCESASFWCRSGSWSDFPSTILMPIQIRIRILPWVLHMLENHKFLLIFIHSNASLHCFIFLANVTDIIIFNTVYKTV